MFSQFVSFVLDIFSKFFNSLKSFQLDNGISLFSVFIFLIFTRIVLLVINYIKHIIDIERADDK